jgi:hypothetical protein
VLMLEGTLESVDDVACALGGADSVEDIRVTVGMPDELEDEDDEDEAVSMVMLK